VCSFKEFQAATLAIRNVATGSTLPQDDPTNTQNVGGNDRAGFFATLEGSDFSRSFFVGFDSSSSRRDQSAQALFGVLQFHDLAMGDERVRTG
jgi:hypothetical protein